MSWQFHPEALVEYLEAVAWYESRRAYLKHFPYHVLFRIADDQLEVLALAHNRRRPLYWRSRIQECAG